MDYETSSSVLTMIHWSIVGRKHIIQNTLADIQIESCIEHTATGSCHPYMTTAQWSPLISAARLSSSRGGRFKSQDGKFSFQFAYCYYVFWYLFLFLLQWMLIIVCFIYCSCFEVNIIYCLLICYTDMLFLLFLHPRTCSWWVEIFPLVFLICIHI